MGRDIRRFLRDLKESKVPVVAFVGSDRGLEAEEAKPGGLGGKGGKVGKGGKAGKGGKVGKGGKKGGKVGGLEALDSKIPVTILTGFLGKNYFL